ncbi:sensor histidine kinase [Nocardia inohanensis]|uniref:sensor histidine kinase n=1 Tax=Nocardia inohanensis TaxID=209246 RepID=UPI001FDF1F70|nr:sensor domain-containing protein [Nocardia inohanensis]
MGDMTEPAENPSPAADRPTLDLAKSPGPGDNPTLALDPALRSEQQPTLALGYGTPPGGQPAAAVPAPTLMLEDALPDDGAAFESWTAPAVPAAGDPGVAGTTTSPGAVAMAVLTAPFRARTWKEFAYLVSTFVLGGIAAAYLFLGWGGGLYLSIFLVGIPVVALVLLGGRIWGSVYRALGRTLLGVDVAAPPEFRSTGLWGFFKAAFTDRTSWRALVFLGAQMIVGLVVGYGVLIVMLIAAFVALSPVLWAFDQPVQLDENGLEHQALGQFGTIYIDTWPKVIGFALIGWAVLWVMPWVVRVVCLVQRWLTAVLLGPTARDRRIVELQESRRAAVDDSTATLRRLERDLHDGTQARLVTIAMALGRAEERLAAGGDARDLIADARASSKEALTELRELVRGIHPPALELGLAPALETLAARCSIPVELRVLLPARPSPAIEAIAYFSVAELLTNVVKHAGANRIWVAVLPIGGNAMAVTVRDNGQGGALQPVDAPREAVVAGGLSGLAARARSVDGTLTVESPIGGPTLVTMTLPIAGPR